MTLAEALAAAKRLLPADAYAAIEREVRVPAGGHRLPRRPASGSFKAATRILTEASEEP